MHPYLIEQLVNERIADLRQAAADLAAHPGRRGGERRLRAARRGGMPSPVITDLRQPAPGGAAETREAALR